MTELAVAVAAEAIAAEAVAAEAVSAETVMAALAVADMAEAGAVVGRGREQGAADPGDGAGDDGGVAAVLGRGGGGGRKGRAGKGGDGEGGDEGLAEHDGLSFGAFRRTISPMT